VITVLFCKFIVSPVVCPEKSQFAPAKSLRVNVKVAASKSFSRIIFTPHTCKAIAEPHLNLSIICFICQPSDNRA
jgi:hypothetical protein